MYVVNKNTKLVNSLQPNRFHTKKLPLPYGNGSFFESNQVKITFSTILSYLRAFCLSFREPFSKQTGRTKLTSPRKADR